MLTIDISDEAQYRQLDSDRTQATVDAKEDVKNDGLDFLVTLHGQQRCKPGML